MERGEEERGGEEKGEKEKREEEEPHREEVTQIYHFVIPRVRNLKCLFWGNNLLHVFSNFYSLAQILAPDFTVLFSTSRVMFLIFL